MSLGRSYCAAHPDDWGCRTARETGTRPLVPPATFVHAPRIAAAVVTAPLGALFTPEGLAGIKAPIQLWRGEVDEIVPQPRHAQNGLTTKPEYHVVPNAGHFAFLAAVYAGIGEGRARGLRQGLTARPSIANSIPR